ncbi:MAG: M3 family peptidase [Planctomycetota bacterium]|nr:MAG: M3 family peptidase [Planctomycetota bacterium]
MTHSVDAHNPLLNDDTLMDYAAVRPEHVEPAISARLAAAEQQLTQLEEDAPEQPGAILAALERLGDGLGRSWGTVTHLLSVQNTPELRAAHAQMQSQVVAFHSRMSQSRPLYEALRRAQQHIPSDNRILQRLFESELRGFIHGGVALPDEQRERARSLRQELAQLSTDFSNHLLDSTKAWRHTIHQREELDGLPPRVLAMLARNAVEDGENEATAEDGPWTLTVDAPCLQPVLQHCRNRSLRARIHQAATTRACSDEHDNRPLIRRILHLRQELAQLLGFPSYAALSLDGKMAPDVAAIDTLLDQLEAAARPIADRDMAAMRTLAANDGIDEGLHAWDLAYYSERLREQRLQLDEEALRAWFPAQRVLDGLFAFLEDIFAVRIVAADGQAPVWHDQVRFFHVLDDQGAVRAAFYLDSFARPGSKRSGAWMNGLISRSNHLPGGMRTQGVRIPVAVLATNVAAPDDQGVSLLSFREVETLFHECGHGLQHMLTTVDCSLSSGINNVEWDAVELPSQFLEQWCYHPPTLRRISGHYVDGSPLPKAMMERVLEARCFNQGIMTLRQLTFARIDLRLHEGFLPDNDDDAIAVQHRIMQATLPLPPEPYDRFLCGFAHIFAGGYAAGYYSYKWAEVLAADAWGAFVEADLDDPQALRTTAKRFRDTILALGGSVHPMQVFTSFRGREPQAQALIELLGLDAA